MLGSGTTSMYTYCMLCKCSPHGFPYLAHFSQLHLPHLVEWPMSQVTYAGSLPNWRPLHTQGWEPVTITPQALSLVDKAEPAQVCLFTLRMKDQQSTWIQDGCEVYMECYMASNGSCFMMTWTIFKNHLLEEARLTRNQDTMAVRTFTTVGLFYFFHVWGRAWIETHWVSIWLRARSHMSSHYTWGSVTTLHKFGGVLGRTAFGHFLVGSHNFMVTALGSYVKWPLAQFPNW